MEAITEGLSAFFQSIFTGVGDWGLKLIGALAALILGFWIIGMLMRAVGKAFERNKIDATLRPFLITLTGFLLKALLFISIAGIVGIPTTSFAALLAGAGVAVGAAFNGTLGQLASGIMLLVFRPIKVGDLIETNGTLGFVREISVFVTVLETFQSKTEIIPNTSIISGKITNYSTIGHLRVDIPFGIQYGADIDEAKKIVMNVLKNDPHVMQDPGPRVAVNNLGENGVELLALPYSTCEDYWDVYWDTREKIVRALGSAGFAAPLPQRIVKMNQ